MRKWIEPVEAFRVLFRARHPERAKAADDISSYRWFWYWKSLGVPEDVYQAADAALKELHQHVKDGRIRLRGEMDSSKPPVDIDEIDCTLGRLTVWDSPGQRHEANQLIIEGKGISIDRVWRRVHCSADDLANIIASNDNPADIDRVATTERAKNVEEAVGSVTNREEERDRQASTVANADRTGRTRGRKSLYDWDDTIQFIEQEWLKNGDPDDFQNRKVRWASDEDIARAALDYMATCLLHDHATPDVSTVRRRLKPVLARLRSKQA
jgi:hypothetical protein